MALIKCRECGNQVSTEAAACPHCGAPQRAVPLQPPPTIVVQHQPPPPQKKGIGLFSGCLIIFLGLLIAGAIITGITPSTRDTSGSPSAMQPTRAPAAPSSEFVSTPPPTGFRSFKWGDSPTETLKKTASHPDGTTVYVPPDGTKPEPLFDIPVAEEAFMFSQGRFYSGSAWLDSRDNFDKMRAELIRQFGEPSLANPRISLWKWKWQDEPVEVSLSYQERFAKTTVTMENKKY